MSSPTMQPSSISVGDLTARLRERLADYVDVDASLQDLTLMKVVRRQFCNLYLYGFSSRAIRPDVLIKVPTGPQGVAQQERNSLGTFAGRPRLFRAVDPANTANYEYAALRRIQTHFTGVHDPRFGVVRAYDLFPAEQAMVIQWIAQPSLRERLYATHRFGSAERARRLESAFSHVGAWLRSHHALAPLSHCQTRNTSREDYLESIERFVAYLMDHVGNQDDIRRMHKQIVALAYDHLPPTIPTGQVHGDFAPRNVFVDPTDRVSVFDTLGRFEAPIYEDIAKMLMTVTASGPQLLSLGLLYEGKRLRRFEQSFLEGYFSDQPIPFPAVGLFLTQLLLEQWAAVVYRYQQQRGAKRVVNWTRLAIWQAGFQAYLREILTTLRNTPIGTEKRAAR